MNLRRLAGVEHALAVWRTRFAAADLRTPTAPSTDAPARAGADQGPHTQQGARMSNHIDTAHDLPNGSRSPLSQRLKRGALPEAEQPGYGDISQRLLWSVLKKEAFHGLPERFRFCEADQSSWGS